MVVGSGLAVAGATFQGLLRNPLADPYVLGTASGLRSVPRSGSSIPVQVVVLQFGLVHGVRLRRRSSPWRLCSGSAARGRRR